MQTCPQLKSPNNGYFNVPNYFEGAKAQFGCFTNFTINFNMSFICDTSYQWKPSNWTSIVCSQNSDATVPPQTTSTSQIPTSSLLPLSTTITTPSSSPIAFKFSYLTILSFVLTGFLNLIVKM